MSNTINKANIAPIPTDRFIISTSDVVTYLENQLGFKISCDFTRWTGVSAHHSYVRMRCVIAPKDIIVPIQDNDYVDRVLFKNASSLKFKDSAIETLTPFMYSKTLDKVRNQPEVLERLQTYGLYGDRLEEVIKYSKLSYTQSAGGVFTIFLRPERIITDMLANPKTNEVDGELAITDVYGTTTETIRWAVEVARNNNIASALREGNISIDEIFNNRA